MAVSNIINLSATSEVTTQRPSVIGQLREEQDVTYGYRLLRMVKNTSGSPIVANSAVAFASGSSENVALATAGALKQTIAGIVVATIPNNYWGWAVCSGDCAAISDANVAANARVRVVAASGTNGRLDDAAVAVAEDEFIGLCTVGTAAGANQPIRVRLSGLI